MRPHPALNLLWAAATAATLSACGSSVAPPATVARPAPASARVSGAVGDTATFKVSNAVIGYSPDRVTFELSRLGYVTLIGIDSNTIVPILPLAVETPRIEMAGSHTFGLNARARAVGAVSAVSENVAELQAYNRCIREAIAYDKARAERSRKVIGRDTAGRPIYGPPEMPIGRESAESRCEDPTDAALAAAKPDPAMPAKQGRYLLLYVSDTPVSHQAIVALTITESDPRLMAISVGRKLFGGRDALWAGYYKSW